MIDSDVLVAFCVGFAVGLGYATIVYTIKDIAEKEQAEERDNGFPRNLP
jgi:hypothetical protein